MVDVLCGVLSGANFGPNSLSLTSEFDQERRRQAEGIPLTPNVWSQLEMVATELGLHGQLDRLTELDGGG